MLLLDSPYGGVIMIDKEANVAIPFSESLFNLNIVVCSKLQSSDEDNNFE